MTEEELNSYEYKLEMPKKQWLVRLNSQFVVSLEEGKQPCAFHRWMQRMLLGFKWERMQ